MDPKWIDHYHSKEQFVICYDCKREFIEGRMEFFQCVADGNIQNICEDCFNKENSPWKMLEV